MPQTTQPRRSFNTIPAAITRRLVEWARSWRGRKVTRTELPPDLWRAKVRRLRERFWRRQGRGER